MEDRQREALLARNETRAGLSRPLHASFPSGCALVPADFQMRDHCPCRRRDQDALTAPASCSRGEQRSLGPNATAVALLRPPCPAGPAIL